MNFIRNMVLILAVTNALLTNIVCEKIELKKCHVDCKFGFLSDKNRSRTCKCAETITKKNALENIFWIYKYKLLKEKSKGLKPRSS
ncbi:uncharacterized protein LOC136077610 isoform X1 [Hydra vulgaris]|uniref:uncharacterized protein LOC136077610 isoform X1 n=1 Tax=Hydra vulgaris TaxID=6087 RepID=UPI0032EA4A90